MNPLMPLKTFDAAYQLQVRERWVCLMKPEPLSLRKVAGQQSVAKEQMTAEA